MIQLLPEPKMAEDFEKTTININAIYFCGEISDELRKLARERFWNYQDIKINEASEDNFKVTAVHALPDIEVEDMSKTFHALVDIMQRFFCFWTNFRNAENIWW